MHLDLHYDREGSLLAEKMIFSCDTFDLSREDILLLRDKKIIGLVHGEDLPEVIPCQLVVQCEDCKTVTLMFFNPDFVLPPAVYEEPFLNKDLIASSEANGGGFRLSFSLPLHDAGIEMNFVYDLS